MGLLEKLGSLEPKDHVVHQDQLVPRETRDQLDQQDQMETTEALGHRALKVPLGLLDNQDRLDSRERPVRLDHQDPQGLRVSWLICLHGMRGLFGSCHNIRCIL